jgi:electron transfer flavoprotein beta subunit
MNQTGQLLASMANLPLAAYTSLIEIEDGIAKITREIDAGLQRITVPLPAVFTCDLRLNTPRFANVGNILKAKKKPMEIIQLKEMGLDIDPRLKFISVESPTQRAAGAIVDTVDELIDKLKNEAKVI